MTLVIMELLAVIALLATVFTGLLVEPKEKKIEVSPATKEMNKARLYSLYLMHKEQGNEIKANGYKLAMENVN